MLKKSFVAVFAVFGVIAALPAVAAESLTCAPPTLNAPSAVGQSADYTIRCTGIAHETVTPEVTFQGKVGAEGTPPYYVSPSYLIDIRGDTERELGSTVREDQIVQGELRTSTLSVAALPAQLSASTVWDADSGTLSIQDAPGLWHVYTMRVFDSAVPSEQTLVDAGYASRAVNKGRATRTVVFDKQYSRFAGRVAELPIIHAQLDLRDGKLEMLVGDTRVSAEQDLQNAIMQLDRKPADITRAWALASRAQFLGLDDDVRYAEQKVAAHNPELLDDFEDDVKRISPYVLPTGN